MKNISADQFISHLYRETARVSLADFPVWALDLLQQTIKFDGAIWGTGHISSREFHTQTVLDVPSEIFTQLKNHLDINPIFDQLVAAKGNAVDMADVLSDDNFYDSPVYHLCFKPLGIERILSSIHVDERSGIFTLLSLYRFDRDQHFTEHEKNTQSRLLYHLLSAASYRQFLALNEIESSKSTEIKSAICDCEGVYHVVDGGFLDIIEAHLSIPTQQKLPFKITPEQQEFSVDNLHFNQEKLGDLYRISVRVKNKLDGLSAREKQVVAGVCQGSTFKQIARQLQLSPSTVSNHLYRIYLKLGINTRSELVALAQDSVFVEGI